MQNHNLGIYSANLGSYITKPSFSDKVTPSKGDIAVLRDIDDAELQYVKEKLANECGGAFLEEYSNQIQNKTEAQVKELNNGLFFLFRNNDKIVEDSMRQRDGFLFKDEKCANDIIGYLHGQKEFDSQRWRYSVGREPSQWLKDMTKLPDPFIKYYRDNQEVFAKESKQALFARNTALQLNMERKLDIFFKNPDSIQKAECEIFSADANSKAFSIL